MKKLFKAWGASEDGATAIEYSLIATGVALAIVLAVCPFGGELSVFFDSLLTTFEGYL